MAASYLDFDLEIGIGQGREDPVTVRSPAGEVRETMQLPFDQMAFKTHLLELENALLRSGGPPRRALSTEQQAVRTFGQALLMRSSPGRSAVVSTPAKSALPAKTRGRGYDFTASRRSWPLCPGSSSMTAATITF